MVHKDLGHLEGTYPSDFAKRHGLDLRLVLAVFSQLERDGEIELTVPPPK